MSTTRTRTPAPAPAALGADTPLKDLVDSWGTHLAAERKAAGTRRLYLGTLAAFTAWHAQAAPGVSVTGSCLDRKTAAAYLADTLAQGAAAATARARYAALRQFTRWLAEEGETDGDVLAGMRPPKLDQPKVDSITGDELAAMLRACRVPQDATRWETFECLRDEAVIRLLADTGMRAGECVALRVDDVDLQRRILTVSRAKGGKHRISAFSPATARAIDRYLRRARRGHPQAAGGRLWLGTSGRGWTYHGLRGAVAKRAELAGVQGMHPHRLRHTAASNALDAGISEGEVMASFGWSSRQMLDRYTADTSQRRAVASFHRYFDGQGR
jgi:site-specific recombinase XerD